MGNISQYRQPMVTSTGIFLGFMLNVSIGWISDAPKDRFRDIVIALCIITTLSLLAMVLYRMLTNNYKGTDENTFYKKTLYMFIIGICIPFFAIVLIMIEKLVTGLGS